MRDWGNEIRWFFRKRGPNRKSCSRLGNSLAATADRPATAAASVIGSSGFNPKSIEAAAFLRNGLRRWIRWTRCERSRRRSIVRARSSRGRSEWLLRPDSSKPITQLRQSGECR